MISGLCQLHLSSLTATQKNGPISRNKEYRQYSPQKRDLILPILFDDGMLSNDFGDFGGFSGVCFGLALWVVGVCPVVVLRSMRHGTSKPTFHPQQYLQLPKPSFL